uniref:Pappalysin-1 n=1 Tax=Panagrolaimus sp. ES5 TaxID=591445 RepID=A0AC34F1E7_9BILA
MKDDYYGDFFDSKKVDLFSVYLNGSSALKLDDEITEKLLRSLNENLKLEVTVFIEDGQMPDVSILELADICSDKSLIKLSIQSEDSDGERDLRFSISLKESIKAVSGNQVRTNVESKIVFYISDNEILLIIDGAKVAKKYGQNIFPLFHWSQFPCIRFFVGTDKSRERLIGFRGGIKDMKISSTISNVTFINEPFANLSNWNILGSTTSVWESFHRPFFASLPFPNFIPIPQCGLTQCDNPEVILNYASDPSFQPLKTLSYTLVVVSNDDGTNSIISQNQIDLQHSALNEAFRPYNITFALNITRIQRSDLRNKVLIFGCASANVGDGICQKECQNEITGDDGGDCSPTNYNSKCHTQMIRNGKCDSECNIQKFDFDGGDCCLFQGTEGSCIDPKSPYRRYMTPHEYKQAIKLPNFPSLVVYFANWPFESLVGLSTFPWESEATSPSGGIIIQPHRFGISGQMGHFIHEIGHALGLWHVHHGITEVACDDPCFEESASLEKGDLVADTAPTPKNDKCEATNMHQFSCGKFRSFFDAPVKNYMSYSLGGCSDHFTPQQAARMHCYIDLKYSGWQRLTMKSSNNHITVKPRILPKNGNLTLWWPLPLISFPCRPFAVTSLSSYCTPDRRIVQFGHSASSRPPDAEVCTPSVHAWLPDSQNCDEENSEKCILRLWPEFEAVVERITIWITWNAANGIRRIKLIFGDDSERDIDEVFAQCDQPFSFNVYETRRLKEVQIHINNPFVAIDAIKFISTSNDGQCNHCMPTMYRIHRSPKFKDGNIKETIENFFEDSDVNLMQGYEYSIGVVDEYGYESVASPKALFDPSSMDYCGDGKITGNEECDDGNLLGNDGCSTQCKIENGFKCKGIPSECYVYENDDICENISNTEKSCQKNNYTKYEISPLTFRAFLAPRNGPLKATDLKMCELQTFISSKMQSPNIFANCSTEFINPKTNFSLTMKAEFPEIFATHLIITTDSIKNFTDKETDMINFKISGVFEDDSIHDFDELTANCSETPLTLNLLPYITKFDKLLKMRAIVLKDVTSETLMVTSMKLLIENSMDLWSIRMCYEQNAYFEPETGICVPKNGKPTICKNEPLIAYPLISNCSNSTKCQITCAKGFEPLSPLPLIHCSSKGEWHEFISKSSPLTFCQPIICEWPKILFGDVECPKGTGIGQNCSINCDTNSVFIGDKKKFPIIQCLENGKWTELEGFCLPICNIEDAVANKNISKENINCRSEIDFPGDQRFNSTILAVNSVCRATCKKNHRASDSDLTKIKLSCGSYGAWLGPSCTLAKCPSPKLVYTGLYNCTDGFNVGSECTYTCPGQQIKKSRCLSSGRQSCTTKCSAPGYDVVKEAKQQLTSGQTLMHYSPISTISCTASTKLYPNPESLKCARTCNMDLIGDGWCDFQNNRGYCNFDGGDCCSSTSRSGKVRFMFPSLCTNAFCQCLDPNSNENYYRYQTINSTMKRERKERSNRRFLAGSPAIKRHWIEKLFHWLDATISTELISNDIDLLHLADSLALFQTTKHSNNIKYSQISKLNFQMRSLQSRKASEAMRRKLAQTAIESANTQLMFKSFKYG